jgi:MFS family permease
MAPDLARELALEPAALSTVASAYFFAYAIMQVPTGMLLDRFGSRRTIAGLLVFTAIGSALFAVGSSPSTLTVARLLMGLGCAGIFTGAFYVLAHWLQSDRLVTQVGALNSFSGLGSLCATTPFAALIAAIGWRQSYWLFTAVIALLTLTVAIVLRDAPPDRPVPPVRPQGLVSAIAGVLEAIKQPGMRRLLVAGLPMSSAGTIAGVWGAPYLADVHGLNDIGRGNVLLAMAASAIAGHFLHGQLARRLNTLKGMILAGSCIIFLATAALAVLERPPLPLAAALFCLIGLAGAFPAVAHAHTRGLVAANLVGRGISLTNMGIMAAVAFMQLLFGWIVGAFAHPGGAPPEQAYRAGFAALAAAALLAIAVYAPVRDVRPRG